ncbi:unnamed protein product [Peronospora belbahrii]|uniref:Uncharacterized protein n=1 Tax=Peronospora belbahrii TaxID=622444 RepID=A0AAU9KQR2_9STRA|nr:unnamed protein product [Peronospora belbahrii]CAH0520602.1 unnamed protein product [Peronospora belbahrii]
MKQEKKIDDTISNGTLRSEPATASAVMNAAFKLGSVLNATSTIESTYPNWVGTELDTSFSYACWRRTHIAKTCPLGYEKRIGICWSQCPYSYPVECGLECIRQNDNCALAIVTKVAVVVQTTLALSAWSVYGDMTKWAKGVQLAIKCTKYMISLSKSLVKFIRYIKVHEPNATKDKIFSILYRIDNVIIDIPVSISYCLGKKVPDDVKFTDSVLMTAEYAIKEIITYGGGILSSWNAFTKFMKRIMLGDSLASLTETDITSLKSMLESDSTCGYDMKRLVDRTWMTVAELRRLNPEISENDIRVFMSQSNLVQNDIPTATNNCIPEMIKHRDISTAYVTRSILRKAFGVIIDDLVKSGTSNNGTFLTAEEYAVRIADRAIAVWAIWDMYYLSSVMSEYFQPLCSQPELMGEIDDGNVTMALGMSIVGDAFKNSDGTWTKVSDGFITITFKSIDAKEVTVHIKSGGDKVDEVGVLPGATVTWKSSVAALGGKTLYLDSCRPGFLGFPHTGGGSLLLWIPRSTQGGSLQLTAVLNKS